MSAEFVGRGRALSDNGFQSACDRLGVSKAELWSVVTVETSGCGFLADRRPQILFERHIFHRLTQGQFDDGNISDPTPGGYGPDGAFQYQRLAIAIAKDRAAALQSASWGIGQIVGSNFRAAGFNDVETMVAAMVESEDAQLASMAQFMRSAALSTALQKHDWATFARGYNGPNFAINQYDNKLGTAFARFLNSGVPPLDIRAIQLYLTYLGFSPGPIDGDAGPRTFDVVQRFATQAGLAPSIPLDGNLVAILSDKLTAIAAAA